MDFTNDDIGRFEEIASARFVPANLPSANEDARIDSTEVARLSGLKRRTVTAHAARGLIPGARRFGAKWTFDAETIRAWVKGTREWTTTEISTSAKKPGGSARPSADGKSVKAFERLASRPRARPGTPVSPNSAPRRRSRAA